MERGLLERLRRLLWPGRRRGALTGTRAEDVYYCYRLLLNREPDDQEWAYWTDLLEQHNMPLAALVDNFVHGDEFRQLQAERHEPRLVTLPQFGIYVRLNDHFIGGAIARRGEYEPHVAEALGSLLAPGAVFVDVGANIGYFTLLAATLVGPEGRVLAFEPRPENCDLLRRSVAENGFEQIRLYEKAVADSAGLLAYGRAGGADSNGRLLPPAEVAAERAAPQMVEAVMLDEALADLQRVDVIKMDIEGAEPLAWRGMQRIVARHRPSLLLEFSPALIRTTSGMAPEQFLAALQAQYELYVVDARAGVGDAPQTGAGILARQQASGHTHLDLLARPS